MRALVSKLAMGLPLLGAAVVIAAAFGALHNQISYTVGPTYFQDLKFAQFGIDPALHDRVGAALVGVQASWWMGLVLGVPIFALSLFVPRSELAKVFLKAMGLTVGIAALIGLGALYLGIARIDAGNLPDAMRTHVTSDPVGFARAGVMHDASYLGGIAGGLIGCLSVIRAARRSRYSIASRRDET